MNVFLYKIKASLEACFFVTPFLYFERPLHKVRTKLTLCEKYPNTELFLVRIFLYSDLIWRDNPYLSVFSPNTGKYGLEITPYLDTSHAV